MASGSESMGGHGGFLGGARVIGGVLLLVVLGANLGTDSARWAQVSRGHAAEELETARRIGERVARAFWTLVGRPEALMAEPAGFGPQGSTRAITRVAVPARSTPVKGIEPGVWLLDLPPPTLA